MRKIVLFGLLILLFIGTGTAMAIDLENGLIAYYSFDDGTAKDNSGNGNDGTIYGAGVVDGIKGKALYFDGVDDRVKTSLNWESQFNVGSPYTVSLWFKGVTTNENSFIFASDVGGPDNRVTLLLDGAVSVRVYGGDHGISDKSIYNDNIWHHVVWGYDGTKSFFYVDGVKQSDSPIAGNYNRGKVTWLGTRSYSGTLKNWFKGAIDEVRIYNRALSEEEIKALYRISTTPEPILSLNIDIDTSLKQGEIRKGTLAVKNDGNSDAKSVKVKLSSESLGINIEKSYDRIPAGEAREFVFEVNANEAGTFKLNAYAECWDDKGNKYVETSERTIHVESVGAATSEKTSTPGFEALFAFAGLLTAMRRLRRRKNQYYPY